MEDSPTQTNWRSTQTMSLVEKHTFTVSLQPRFSCVAVSVDGWDRVVVVGDDLKAVVTGERLSQNNTFS